MSSKLFSSANKILSYKVTPPTHLCMFPCTLGFIVADYSVVLVSPYVDLAGLGLLAPFLAPFFAVFFAAWLQFRIRNENQQLLQSKFAIMFAAGAVLGLSCMIALTPVLLDLPFSVTITSLVVALAIAPLLAAEGLSRKLTACQQAKDREALHFVVTPTPRSR